MKSEAGTRPPKVVKGRSERYISSVYRGFGFSTFSLSQINEKRSEIEKLDSWKGPYVLPNITGTREAIR